MNLFKAKFSKLVLLSIALAFFVFTSNQLNIFSVKIAHAFDANLIDSCGLASATSGSFTKSGGTCQINANQVSGLGAGQDLILSNGAVLTIKTGAELILAPGAKIILNSAGAKGSIVMETGGDPSRGVRRGYLALPDADADGFINGGATTFTKVLSNVVLPSPFSAGYTEKSALKPIAQADCNDAAYSLTNVCCASGYRDYDKDGSGKKDDALACYPPDAAYNVVANNYDCDDNNAGIYHGWSVGSFCGTGTCGGSGTDSCMNGVRSDSCVTSPKACCNAGVGTYKAAQTPISTCLKCNGTQADPINQTAAEDLNNTCTTGALGSGTSCTAGTCSGSGDSCGAVANGTICSYDGYSAWTGANGACFATRSRGSHSCSAGTCSVSATGTDYDANQNASSAGNVWNGSAWTAASCSSYCNIQTAYCTGQTLARGVYGCNMSGSCDNVTVRAACPPGGCTGGENARCSGSSCVNTCSNGSDDDGDGFTDGQDTDCGGYGQCSSGTCCNTATGQFKNSATICSNGTFNNPASGSCQRVATDQYCSGAAAACTGSTVNRYDNAPSSGNVWNGSAWAASTGSLYCGSSGANTCSGQTVQKDAYGCNTSGSCSTTPNGYKINTGTICSGGENDFCSGGTCANLCSDSLNNDGDTYTDSLDSDCGAQCSSGACCDTGTNRYRPSSYTCNAAADLCDIAENCTGTSNTCPTDVVKSNGTSCRASAGVCDLADNCNGVAKTCTDNKSTALYSAASDLCDVADYCSGSSNSAPADAVKGNGTLCRNSGGSCDNTDYCNGSTKNCADSQVANGTVCNTGSWTGFYNSAGACYAERNQPYYTCSSGSCSGSVSGYNYDYSYGSAGQVWNGSSWAAGSGGNYCGTNGSYSCSGNTTILTGYYACNGGNSCNYFLGNATYTNCSGAENSMCVAGNWYCTNMCTAGVDNNGNGFNDAQDGACGGCGQCTSGSCCNTGNGCYYGSGTVCSWGGFNNPGYGACSRTATDQYCSGSSSACNGGTATRYEYAPANGYFWNSSSWVYASAASFSIESVPYFCSGSNVSNYYYGCNTSGGYSGAIGTKTISTCSGGTPYCYTPGGAANASCVACTADAQCGANYYYCSSSQAWYRTYYCAADHTCSYYNSSTSYCNAGNTQICTGSSCVSYCGAQTVSGYNFPITPYGAQSNSTNSQSPCYHSGAGSFTATAFCNSGSLGINSHSYACNSGYRYTNGAWYQSNYGCYDVCMQNCSAGSYLGYSYGAIDSSGSQGVSKSVGGGSCSATISCFDGTRSISGDGCSCYSGYTVGSIKTSPPEYVCLSCPAGYWCNGTSHSTTLGEGQYLCPANTYSGDGAGSCSDCPYGWTSPAGSTSYSACVAPVIQCSDNEDCPSGYCMSFSAECHDSWGYPIYYYYTRWDCEYSGNYWYVNYYGTCYN